MSWKCYLVIYKALTPIHIGYRQIGILKTTRYYIPGKTMWGAITANLTRALFENPEHEDYKKVGEFVKRFIKTTYFFPAIEEMNSIEIDKLTEFQVILNGTKFSIFLPNYTEEGLKFGNLFREEFEQIFISSFVSTAIELQTRTAEEGSLHEFEFIQPKICIIKKKFDQDLEKNIAQVYWLGYFFVNINSEEHCKDFSLTLKEKENDVIILKNESSKSKEISLKNDILTYTFVGGERNYGCGRLYLENENSFQEIQETQKIFGKFKIKLNFQEPLVVFEESKNIFGHAEINSFERVKEIFENFEIEPFIGLEWGESGAGLQIGSAFICTSPGSKVKSKKELTIGDYGIFKNFHS